MLAKLKDINTERLDMTEAIALAAFAGIVVAKHNELGVSPPDWLTDAKRTLDADVAQRQRDALSARLRRVETEQASLKTREERRADLVREAEELRAKLGVA